MSGSNVLQRSQRPSSETIGNEDSRNKSYFVCSQCLSSQCICNQDKGTGDGTPNHCSTSCRKCSPPSQPNSPNYKQSHQRPLSLVPSRSHISNNFTAQHVPPGIQRYAHSHLPERIGIADYVMHQHSSPFVCGTSHATSQRIEGSTFVLGMQRIVEILWEGQHPLVQGLPQQE
jgi:hypothetical protein